MKKIIVIIILNLFFYFGFLQADEISNNHLKWKVEFKTLRDENKLMYCYPFYGKMGDYILNTHIYYLKVKKVKPTKEIINFAKENYVKYTFRQHIIFDNHVWNELDPLSKSGHMTPELKETYIKNNQLIKSSGFLINYIDTNFTKTGIPDLCDQEYDKFIINNKKKLQSKFPSETINSIKNIFSEDFDKRLKSNWSILKKHPIEN